MNKGELVDRMAKSAGIFKSAADKALNGFMEAVTESLNTGEKVTLVGFGTFSVTERKARTGRNAADWVFSAESVLACGKIVRLELGNS